jgi:hypothetical protein
MDPDLHHKLNEEITSSFISDFILIYVLQCTEIIVFRALFYMPLYEFLHTFLNIFVQTANNLGLQKKIQ